MPDSTISTAFRQGYEESSVNPNPDCNRTPDPFERRIEGFTMGRPLMEDAIRRHISAAMREMGIVLRDLILRGGEYGKDEVSSNGGKTKFLETVFEFDDLGRGIGEDEVARYMEKFHPLAIEGVKVTMKPVNDRQSGSIDDYWARFTAQREAKEAQIAAEKAKKEAEFALRDLAIPAEPPYMGDPDDDRDKDVMAKHDFDKNADIAGGEPREGWKLGEVRGIPFSRDEITQIAAALGTTTELENGGWILPDGRLLSFIRDGVRRDDSDIGIGFTESRKDTLAKYQKAKRAGKPIAELKDNGSGLNIVPEVNGGAQSAFPPNPEDNVAKNEFKELYPLEALKGGLIRYGVSDDDNIIEIDAYSMPTQGQFDVLEDMHEWVKFVDEGGYDKKRGESAAPKVMVQKQPEQTQQPALPSGEAISGDEEDTPDAFDMTQVKEYESFEAKPKIPVPPAKGQIGEAKQEDEPEPPVDEGKRLIIVYVGEGPDDWWDYTSVEDLRDKLVKDLRTYFREGKKPNDDISIPETGSAMDESIPDIKKVMEKRGYRPRTTLLHAINYDLARRICRENLALIRTIPILDLMKAEQKVIAYFRGRITRNQLASYFFRAGDGAITHRHAELIADDQINKATERMRVAQWRGEGIKMVRWVHSGVGEPRPYHREKWNGKSGIYDGRPNGLNGFVFPIDFPPIINKDSGERGYPGHLPFCKCHLEPVW